MFAMAGLFVQAQDGDMKFGAKLGPNFSTITGDADDAAVRVGLHVGLFAEFMITNDIGIQPELLFSMQGANNDYNYYYGYDGVGLEKVKLNYVNIPILGSYHFAAVKGLSAQFGPQVGILVSAKEEGIAYDNNGFTYRYDVDAKDFYKTVDVGLSAGAQYEFSFGLIAQVRGTFGLTNIYDGPGNWKYRNNMIQLSAAYSFL